MSHIRNNIFRHVFRVILVAFFATIVFADANIVYPESLETALSGQVNDSTLYLRAQLAYSRGLYQTALDIADRIGSPGEDVLLLQGQCSHVLAKPHAARGYFAMITRDDLLPLAQIGLAEIYCWDIVDPDSCALYMILTKNMDYLSRFVELDIPMGTDSVAAVADTGEPVTGWTLQFGAFGLRSLAEQMAVKVRSEGLQVLIVPGERDGNELYFVYGGVFATKGEAAARADALAGEFVCNIVEYPN